MNTDSDNNVVSIIVITYNSGKYIYETLESIKKQNYKEIELIITDDCSQDNTVEICRDWIEREYKRFQRTEIIVSDQNTGTPANCNRGVKAACGDWIKLIAGDDAMTINAISKFVEYSKLNRAAEILHSDVIRHLEVFNEKTIIPYSSALLYKINQKNISTVEQFQILLRTNMVNACSLFIKRSVFEKIGLFDESLKFWEDRPFLIKATQNNIKLWYVNFISCRYRVHITSVQSKNNSKPISSFNLERERYYLNNYLHYLPWFERFIKLIVIKRVLFLDRFGFKVHPALIKIYLFVTSFPFVWLSGKLNKKFI